MNVPSARSSTGKTLLLIGILLIAANLRAPFTSLPPVLGFIQDSFHLGSVATGALTALPLLAFALLSPVSAMMARKHGLERTLFGALIAIALGIVLRSVGASWGLYLGTAIIGMGIAAGNVLLPSLVKRDFSTRVASVTGAYALIMGIAAALGSAVVTPMAGAWGWTGALLAFLVLPVLAMLLWGKQLAAHTVPGKHAEVPKENGKVWHAALAWQVTLFLGLNSTIYYVIVGWLPTILTDAGMSATEAGSFHGVMQLATAVPGLVLGPILRRMRDQRLAGAAVCLCSAIALVGLDVAPQLAIIWSILFGIGTGAGIILGLSLIGLRTRNAMQAAALSGMSQCVGYLLASAGPMVIASLHDMLGGWGIPLQLCAVLAVIAAVMGYLAGRDRSL